MQNLQDKAYNYIYERIMNLRLQPGQQVSDLQFVKEIDVSRTPIREAMLRLRREELLYSMAQSGTFVTKIDMQKALDAQYVRRVIETAIIRTLSADIDANELDELIKIVIDQRRVAEAKLLDQTFALDNLFHKRLYQFANKDNVWQWLQSFSNDLNRYRLLRVYDENLPLTLLSNEHKRIVDALTAHDTDRVAQLMTDHLNLMLKERAEVAARFPEFFKNVPEQN